MLFNHLNGVGKQLKSTNYPCRSHTKCQLDTCKTDRNVGPSTNRETLCYNIDSNVIF